MTQRVYSIRIFYKGAIKNLLFLTLIVICSVTVGRTQDSFTSKTFSLSIGPNIGIFHGDQWWMNYRKCDRVPKAGYTISLGFERAINERFSTTTRFMFEQKGNIKKEPTFYTDFETGEILNGMGKSTYTLNVGSLVGQLNYTFWNNRWKVGAGPYLSYLKNKFVIHEILDSPEFETRKTNLSAIDDFEFGVVFSMKSILVQKEKFDLHVELLNSLGISNIASLPQVIKTNTSSLIFGIDLKL